MFSMSACNFDQTEEKTENSHPASDTPGGGLRWDHSMDLLYADGFSIDYYTSDASKGEYVLISIRDESDYLVIPQGEKVPEGISKDITVLKSPDQIYLVASQVMDMFASIDAMDTLRFSALDADGWYIDEAKEAMHRGDLLYAGKYSAPDYEFILEQGCDLAIENTMIYHCPEVREKLESLGIPVLVDRSSYESDPLGRTEWVKLYGALTGHEKQAEKAFEEQVEKYKEITVNEKEEKPSVAFFYISANGNVKVRKSSDYLPKMIAMAGGSYIFSDLGEEEGNASSTVNMQMEEFYKNAKEADYLLYNSTIEGELSSLDDLLSKHDLLSGMKAVKEGHVYCTEKDLYQSTMELGTIISDIHKMLVGDSDMTYLYQLK